MNKNLISQREATTASYRELQYNQTRQPGLAGTDTGFHDLNMIYGGHRPKKIVTLAERSGSGKCLGPGTEVLMHNGTYKVVEDLKVGDLLMGIDGTPNRITGVCEGEDHMYEIQQNRAMNYVVNSVHVLSLMSRGFAHSTERTEPTNLYSRKGTVVNIPLNEYLKKSSKWKLKHKGYKEVTIYPSQKLPFDPYMLGVWLGDGTSCGSGICTPEPEIKAFIYEFAEVHNLRVRENQQVNNAATEYYFAGNGEGNYFRTYLRTSGLLGNKHIPNEYLVNDIPSRKLLLAGLLDTDGYMHSNGYEITQVRKNLAFQIKQLADSLGYRTYMVEKIVNGTVYYRLSIYGNDLDSLPIRVERKKALPNKGVNKSLTGIKVKSLGWGKYYGFELENDDRRFFLKDNTVTHNTSKLVQMSKAAANVIDGRRSELCVATWEQAPQELVTRFVSWDTGFTNDELTHPYLFTEAQNEAVKAAYAKAAKLPIHYHQFSTDIDKMLSILDGFISNCRAKEVLEGVKIQPVFILDYISMVKGRTKYSNKSYDLGDFLQELKSYSNTTDLSSFILAQILRAADHKDIPEISDIQDSSFIEQNSDVIVLGYRPELRRKETIKDPETGQELPSKGKILWLVEKNRGGRTAHILGNCNVALNRFWNRDHTWDFDYTKLYADKDFWMNQFNR